MLENVVFLSLIAFALSFAIVRVEFMLQSLFYFVHAENDERGISPRAQDVTNQWIHLKRYFLEFFWVKDLEVFPI